MGLKILHIICNLVPAGAERTVLALSRAQRALGLEVQVATIMGGGELEKEFIQAGIPLHLGRKWRRSPGIAILRSLRILTRRYQPDIVHTHLFAGDLWGRLALAGFHPPCLVSTEHNINLDEARWRARLKRVSLRCGVRAIVAVSDAVKQHAIKHDHMPARLLHVIHNGIDPAGFPFHPPRATTPGQSPQLVSVGRLIPSKGIDVLIRAMAECPTHRLEIVGDGPQKGALKRLAASLGLARRIRFVGRHADVRPFLHQADCFIQPSRHEGFGIAVLEAMSTGLPVIASNVDGLKEVIQPSKTGVLVPPDNPRALARAIRSVTETADAQAMGRAARARVEQCFSVETMTRKYIDLYGELLDSTS